MLQYVIITKNVGSEWWSCKSFAKREIEKEKKNRIIIINYQSSFDIYNNDRGFRPQGVRLDEVLSFH